MSHHCLGNDLNPGLIRFSDENMFRPDSFESGLFLCSTRRDNTIATEQAPPLKPHGVTMKMEANYMLLIPAISEVEAIILADEKAIPLAEISGVEKDVVQVAETERM